MTVRTSTGSYMLYRYSRYYTTQKHPLKVSCQEQLKNSECLEVGLELTHYRMKKKKLAITGPWESILSNRYRLIELLDKKTNVKIARDERLEISSRTAVILATIVFTVYSRERRARKIVWGSWGWRARARIIRHSAKDNETSAVVLKASRPQIDPSGGVSEILSYFLC